MCAAGAEHHTGDIKGQRRLLGIASGPCADESCHVSMHFSWLSSQFRTITRQGETKRVLSKAC